MHTDVHEIASSVCPSVRPSVCPSVAACGCLSLSVSVCPSCSLSSLSLAGSKSNIQHASAMDDYGRMTRKEKRDEPQAKTVARFRVHPCANVLARTMSRLSSKSFGHRSHRTRRQSPRWSHRPRPCENPPPSPRSPPLDTIRLSNCRAQTCGTHLRVLRHEAHLLPDAIRTSRTPRPTIRCRQPTPRNAAEKAPPCNFARLATDLDIPKTIRRQRVE